jgi:glycosyltransferase involved in cell wall biosynthesis
MADNHIVLITTGQPSTNPRIVKEADTLYATGYRVTVLYAYWNQWATEADSHLLKHKNWEAIRVGGDPLTDRIAYFKSRFSHLVFKRLWVYLVIAGIKLPNEKLQKWIHDRAISRATASLTRRAKLFKADLYIAHTLGAISAAVTAANANNSLVGFDAEDYHRNEITDDVHNAAYQLNRALEDRYISVLDYFTVSSPQIKALYDQHYKIPSVVIRNVFPKFQKKEAFAQQNDKKRIKLCWFSQTIGPNRGLELLINALSKLNPGTFELHLLGELKLEFLKQLASYSGRNWQDLNVTIHVPVNPDRLFIYLSAFDIGIAAEPAFCINNNVALSNKLFSYIQCGLALLLSDTIAQSGLLTEYPRIGKMYKRDSIEDLTAAIQYFIDHPDDLEHIKKHNYQLGQEMLNWEQEQKKFLHHIAQVLNRRYGMEKATAAGTESIPAHEARI